MFPPILFSPAEYECPFTYILADWRDSLLAQLVKNLRPMQETPVQSVGWEDPWRKDRLPSPVFLVFPGGSDGKESTCNVGVLGSIPGLGRSPGEENGCSFQYSCLKNSMDKGAWQFTVQGVAKSWM